MAFSIGNGLSAMGGAISQTAGAMALEAQKADLDRQKELLVNDLTTGRETALEGQRETAASNLATTTSNLAVGAHKANLATDVQSQIDNAPRLAEIERQKVIANGSDPAFLKATAALANATATPADKAAAFASMQAGYAAQLQTGIAQKMSDAHDALVKAQASGDTVGARQAAMAVASLTFDSKDLLNAAATAVGATNQSERAFRDAQTNLAVLTAKRTAASNPGGEPFTAADEAEIADAKDRVSTLYTAYQNAVSQMQSQQAAARNLTVVGSVGPPPDAKPLSSMMPGGTAPAAPSSGVNLSGNYNSWWDKGMTLTPTPGMAGP